MWHNPRLLNLASAALCVLALALFATTALYWLMQREMFTLKAMRIESDAHASAGALRYVNRATVRAAALPRILDQTHGNFFMADLETVRQAFEGVAWVRRAQVRREWPDRLVVTIEEHRVLGTWPDGRLVNTFGELFAANLAEAEEEGVLPELAGPTGSERMVAQRHGDFGQWFARIGMQPVRVTLSERYAWSVRLRRPDVLAQGRANEIIDDVGAELHAGAAVPRSIPDLRVELGRERDSNTLQARAQRLIEAYPRIAARWPALSSVDLRYPNGFALRAGPDAARQPAVARKRT